MAPLGNRTAGGSVSRRPATSPANRLPNADAMNQTPIICPTRPTGASLVMDESPTGDNASSPQVWKKYVTTSHAIDTFTPDAALAAPHMITKKPTDNPSSPSAN